MGVTLVIDVIVLVVCLVGLVCGNGTRVGWLIAVIGWLIVLLQDIEKLGW